MSALTDSVIDKKVRISINPTTQDLSVSIDLNEVLKGFDIPKEYEALHLTICKDGNEMAEMMVNPNTQVRIEPQDFVEPIDVISGKIWSIRIPDDPLTIPPYFEVTCRVTSKTSDVKNFVFRTTNEYRVGDTIRFATLPK